MYKILNKLKKNNNLINNFSKYLKNEKGEVNIVVILLIIIVAIGLVAIFKKNIVDLLDNLFDSLKKQSISL